MSVFASILLSFAVLLAAKGPQDVIERTVNQLRVGKPVSYRNLTVFPVSGPEQFNLDCLTLDEALRQGVLEVSEVGSGRVNEVRVENTSDRYVFMMAGEVIVGAKQDRMIADDVLVPPKSGRLIVKVYCIERGRWRGPTVAFKAGGTGGHVSLRAMARVTESQSVVWSEVERKQSALGARAEPTGTLVAIQRDEGVQKRIQPYRESPLARLPAQIGRDAVGVVVFVGGRPKAADVFGNHELLRRLWGKLLDSYAMDAIELKEGARVAPVPDIEDARRFLRRALSASATSRETPGAGELISLRSPEITGQALIHENKLVHMELFPRREGAFIESGRYRSPYRVVPRQMPEPVPPGRPRIR
jgi:hypothetical protein